MTTPNNTVLRSFLSTDNDNFFITDGGDKSNYLSFNLDAMSGAKQIIMPDANVDLSNIGGSTALDQLTAGTSAATLTTSSGNILIEASGNTASTIIQTGTDTDATAFVVENSNTTSNDLLKIDGSGVLTTPNMVNIDLIPSGNVSIESSGTSQIVSLGGDTNTGSVNVGTAGTKTIGIGSSDAIITATGNTTDGITLKAGADDTVEILEDAVNLRPDNTITLGHSSTSTGQDFVISQSGGNTSKLQITSAGTGSNSVDLNSTGGGITIQSKNSGSTETFGTLVEGSRMFKVDQSLTTADATVTFTFATSVAIAVYLVEAKLSFRGTSISGARIGKAMFNKTATGTIATPVDSIETFGSPESTIVFGQSGNNITVQMGVTGGNVTAATEIDGTITINGEDTGIVLSTIATA